MVRPDGRSNNDARVASIITGIISNTTGSSCAEIGNNKIVCSVRGPLQLTTEYRGNKGKIVCNVSYAPFAMAKGPRMDPQAAARNGVCSEKELAFILEGICEQAVVLESFPQLCYEINIVVLASEGGNDLPTLCAAASAALMAAGVEMIDIFAASSAAVVVDESNAGSSESYIVDPTPIECDNAAALCTVAATTTTGKTLYYNHEGASAPETIAKLFQHAVAGCHAHRKAITDSAL